VIEIARTTVTSSKQLPQISPMFFGGKYKHLTQCRLRPSLHYIDRPRMGWNS